MNEALAAAAETFGAEAAEKVTAHQQQGEPQMQTDSSLTNMAWHQ